MYEYSATIVSIYDGDTITVDIDLGFHITLRQIVRMCEINAPEIKGEDKVRGATSRDYLRSLLPVGSKVVLETYKDGKEKYGRYLAKVTDMNGVNINSKMVAQGFAEFKEYL